MAARVPHSRHFHPGVRVPARRRVARLGTGGAITVTRRATNGPPVRLRAGGPFARKPTDGSQPVLATEMSTPQMFPVRITDVAEPL